MSWKIRGSIPDTAKKNIFFNVQTISGVHAASDSVVTELSSPEVNCRGVKMTTHLHMAEVKN